jgi:hypothetical protein
MICRFIILFTLVWAAFFAASPVSAVIINSSTGTENTSAPDGDCGWSFTGKVNGCSCVYLGNGWVLTAKHVIAPSGTVSIGSVALSDGMYYSADPSTLQYLVTSGTTTADLALFRLQTTPTGFGTLALAGGTYSANTSVTAIGYGFKRAAGTGSWTVGGTTYTGYAWDEVNGRIMRWGTNTLSSTEYVLDNDGYGLTAFLSTMFDANGGANEMQAAAGDSGGGVFTQIDGKWTLAGIMLTVDTVDSTQAAALFDTSTYFADMRYYSSQIREITGIPEPSTLALLAVGGSACLLVRRRTARRGRGS